MMPPDAVDPLQAWLTHLMQGGGVLGWLVGAYLVLDRLGFIKRKSDGDEPEVRKALVDALQRIVTNTEKIGGSLERLLDRTDSAHDLLVALHAREPAASNGGNHRGEG